MNKSLFSISYTSIKRNIYSCLKSNLVICQEQNEKKKK